MKCNIVTQNHFALVESKTPTANKILIFLCIGIRAHANATNLCEIDILSIYYRQLVFYSQPEQSGYALENIQNIEINLVSKINEI